MSLSPRGKQSQHKIYVFNYLRFVKLMSHWEYEMELTDITNLYKQLEIIDTIKHHICNSDPKDEYMFLLNNLLFIRDYIIKYKLFHEYKRKYLLKENNKIECIFYQDNSIKISLSSFPEALIKNKRLVEKFKELQSEYQTFVLNFNSAKHMLKKLADI